MAYRAVSGEWWDEAKTTWDETWGIEPEEVDPNATSLTDVLKFISSLGVKMEEALLDPRVRQKMQQAGVKVEDLREEQEKKKQSNNLLLWGGAAAAVGFLLLRKK